MSRKPTGTKKRWSKEELAYLDRLWDYYPASVIAGKINYWHERNNRQIVRTTRAIQAKLNHLGFSATPTEDNMTVQEWGKGLGVNKSRSSNWKAYGLKCVLISSNKNMVSVKDMKEFILLKPYLFSDINPDVLEYYFGKDVADVVSNSKNLRERVVPLKRKVMRTDTGEIYPSVSQASKALYHSRFVLYKELKKEDGLVRYV
jgi:hypothetical protein